MAATFDNIADAFELICDGSLHTVDVDNTGATYEGNESTYGEGEVGCWLKLDLTSHNAVIGTDVFIGINYVSGTVVPYIDIWQPVDATWDPTSPDFQKLTNLTSGSLYGDGASRTFNLGIVANDISDDSGAGGSTPSHGSGIFYIFVGDGDFVGGEGVITITYRVNPPDWKFTQLGSSHRAAVWTSAGGETPPPPVLIMGGKVHQVFGQADDVDFINRGPFVYRFDDPSWTDISGDLRVDNTKWVSQIQATNDSSNIYVVWYESDVVPDVHTTTVTGLWHLKKWNGSSWTELGTGQKKNTPGRISGLWVCVYQGQPTVAWLEYNGSSQFDTYVQTWNGSAWVDVGSLPINTNPSRGYGNGITLSETFVAVFSNGDSLAVLWLDSDSHPVTPPSDFHNFINIAFFDGSSWGSTTSLDSQDGSVFNGVATSTTIDGFGATADSTNIYIAASQNGFAGDSPNNVVTMYFPWSGSAFTPFPGNWDDDVSSGKNSNGPSGFNSQSGGVPVLLNSTMWLVAHNLYNTRPANFGAPGGNVSFPKNQYPYVIDYMIGGEWTGMLRIISNSDDYTSPTITKESSTSALVSLAWSDWQTSEWWVDVYRISPPSFGSGSSPGVLIKIDPDGKSTVVQAAI